MPPTKLVVSAGVGRPVETTIEQTDTAADVTDRLASIRPLRTLSRTEGTSDALNARRPPESGLPYAVFVHIFTAEMQDYML
ncbi:hypothetical protein EGH21_03235 [Halomicroarcula sp. F13]|uniref:Uncharacterized protein n=1 Tax=Haloarcula rubra TaxID=2487747 RepID=A0AAW4PNB8_9EURY|nr:hypothetical protein [Halomicroarcula rubra]MBX0322040.1 hypothetical protein [Halomicroarcula rubra]